jgi:hypothetical protein
MTNLLRHAPFTRFLVARVGSIAAQQMLTLAIAGGADTISVAWSRLFKPLARREALR